MSPPLTFDDPLSSTAMEVSSVAGYTSTLEYVNALRAIMGSPLMTEVEYGSAVEECFRVGREVVVCRRCALAKAGDQVNPAPTFDDPIPWWCGSCRYLLPGLSTHCRVPLDCLCAKEEMRVRSMAPTLSCAPPGHDPGLGIPTPPRATEGSPTTSGQGRT